MQILIILTLVHLPMAASEYASLVNFAKRHLPAHRLQPVLSAGLALDQSYNETRQIEQVLALFEPSQTRELVQWLSDDSASAGATAQSAQSAPRWDMRFALLSESQREDVCKHIIYWSIARLYPQVAAHIAALHARSRAAGLINWITYCDNAAAFAAVHDALDLVLPLLNTPAFHKLIRTDQLGDNAIVQYLQTRGYTIKTHHQCTITSADNRTSTHINV